MWKFQLNRFSRSRDMWKSKVEKWYLVLRSPCFRARISACLKLESWNFHQLLPNIAHLLYSKIIQIGRGLLELRRKLDFDFAAGGRESWVLVISRATHNASSKTNQCQKHRCIPHLMSLESSKSVERRARKCSAKPTGKGSNMLQTDSARGYAQTE